MRDRYATIFLATCGFVFAATGLVFTAAPQWVAAIRELAGEASPDALNDVRVIYGALELGLGVFLLACARRADRHEAGMLAVAIVGGAMAASRFLGMALVAGTPVAHVGYGALDLVGVAFAVHGLRRRTRVRALG